MHVSVVATDDRGDFTGRVDESFSAGDKMVALGGVRYFSCELNCVERSFEPAALREGVLGLERGGRLFQFTQLTCEKGTVSILEYRNGVAVMIWFIGDPTREPAMPTV